MSDYNYETLLELSKNGKLSEGEANMVASELQKPESTVNRYTLLHILGRSGFTVHRKLIESFLELKDEPDLANLALQILCSFWDDTILYLDKVISFLRGVSWDTDNDCKLTAISIAGEFLRKNNEPEFLKELLRIFDDGNEKHLLREAAYASIMRTMGSELNDTPSAARPLDLVRDVDQKIIQQARARLDIESRNE